MLVGVLGYYPCFDQIKKGLNMKELFHSTTYEAWEQLIKVGEGKSIYFEKYNHKNHTDFDQIIVIDIPRILELFKILKNNFYKKKLRTILIIHESNLARNRFLLNIPLLFDLVCINTEENNYKFLFYKTKVFSYPALPDASQIKNSKKDILSKKRINKIFYLNSFKIALSRNSTYIKRYKLMKSILNYPNNFAVYGYGWNKRQIPFDIPFIAIINRIQLIKKALTFLTTIFFKPIENIQTLNYKYSTLKKFDFNLAFEPTVGRPFTIFEKLFDPMIYGVIPIYLGPKDLKNIPSNCYIAINKNITAKSLLKEILHSLSDKDKENYRKRIYKFLISKEADKYRFSTYVDFVINTLLENK